MKKKKKQADYVHMWSSNEEVSCAWFGTYIAHNGMFNSVGGSRLRASQMPHEDNKIDNSTKAPLLNHLCII